jgi:hypothetical protein
MTVTQTLPVSSKGCPYQTGRPIARIQGRQNHTILSDRQPQLSVNQQHLQHDDNMLALHCSAPLTGFKWLSRDCVHHWMSFEHAVAVSPAASSLPQHLDFACGWRHSNRS